MNKVPDSVVLMHLSQESNTKEKALESLESFLEFDGTDFKSMHVTVASQDCPSERLTIGTELPQRIRNRLIENIEINPSYNEAVK
ncbi:MAG: hypothetical protein IKP71_13910, partial [Candidatus Riflebacteria bacterium]|nr:hypothetical protein [Candidatus Riflebacteria bacterium]